MIILGLPPLYQNDHFFKKGCASWNYFHVMILFSLLKIFKVLLFILHTGNWQKVGTTATHRRLERILFKTNGRTGVENKGALSASIPVRVNYGRTLSFPT